MVRLLLISNSTGPDGGYLDHCAGAIASFLAGSEPVLFVPFALDDEAGYGTTACTRLERMGLAATWADRGDDPVAQLERAGAVFIGGGNTFRLLDRLYDTGMLEAVRDAVGGGMPYVGTSAGVNVACPTIMTTNDMPITEPPSFAAMGLVPFQINSHYVDRDPDSSHQGETREERLTEFLEMNDVAVVALREGAMLRVEGREVTLGGGGARIYRRTADPVEHPAGTRLTPLLPA
jgi:dipeptidase E